MSVKHWMIGAASLIGASFASMPSQAAPLAGAATDLKAAAGQSSSVDKVAYRRCWWRHGVRHCRWYRSYGYSPYYYGYDPYFYGPSIGFFFGGGGHHHRHFGGRGFRGHFGGHHHR